MKYPIQCKNIIDVTKAPYFADNTGKKDCTKILQQVFDDILMREVEGVEKSKQLLLEMGDKDVYRGFENAIYPDGKIRVIYPEVCPPSRIIYFPKGTYLVSDTISYTLTNLKNIFNDEYYSELCRGIHIMGESADDTIIRLADNSFGFEEGANKPVLSLNTRREIFEKETTNVAQLNTIEDLTIDCGNENMGAVGLRYSASNSGRIENLNIISKGGKDAIQIAFGAEGIVDNIKCEGFEYGMNIPAKSSVIVIDNADFSKCTKAGIISEDSIVNVGKVNCGNIPAVAFREGNGFYYITDKNTPIAEDKKGNNVYYDVRKPVVERYIPKNERSTDPNDWVCVDDFGAVGDGVTDSTVAIQKAMNSGKPIVIFGEGHYLINGTIKIPKTVKTVDFMFCDLFAGGSLIGGELDAAFDICQESDDILFLENLYTFEQFYGHFRCVRQTAKRDLVLSDFHNQASASYFNTVGGSKVYLDNCASTIGTYSLGRILVRTGYKPVYNHMIPYEFHNQTLYGRNVNPERADVELLNDNSVIMIDGYKVEGPGVAVKTINGGNSQINVGTCGIGCKDALNGLWETDDAHALVQGVRMGVCGKYEYNIVIKQTTNGKVQLVHRGEFNNMTTSEKHYILNYYNSDEINEIR